MTNEKEGTRCQKIYYIPAAAAICTKQTLGPSAKATSELRGNSQLRWNSQQLIKNQNDTHFWVSCPLGKQKNTSVWTELKPLPKKLENLNLRDSDDWRSGVGGVMMVPLVARPREKMVCPLH